MHPKNTAAPASATLVISGARHPPTGWKSELPGSLGAPVQGPHQSSHLALHSGEQGLQERWGGVGMERLSIIDDHRASVACTQ